LYSSANRDEMVTNGMMSGWGGVDNKKAADPWTSG
jgi:hypothetical protein